VFAQRKEAIFFVCRLPIFLCGYVVRIGGGLGWRAPNSQDIKIFATKGLIHV
jgi:hypothetical protein